jgi:hypothetical protein
MKTDLSQKLDQVGQSQHVIASRVAHFHPDNLCTRWNLALNLLSVHDPSIMVLLEWRLVE